MSGYENKKILKILRRKQMIPDRREECPEFSVVFKLSGRISRNKGKYLLPGQGNLWQTALTNSVAATYILEGNDLYVIDNKVNRILSKPGTVLALYMANEKHLSRRIVGEN